MKILLADDHALIRSGLRNELADLDAAVDFVEAWDAESVQRAFDVNDDLDLALVKHTKLSERTDLEFRAEVFDVTNTPAFAQPNGSFGSTAFGSINATVTDPRVVQFALRLSR